MPDDLVGPPREQPDAASRSIELDVVHIEVNECRNAVLLVASPDGSFVQAFGLGPGDQAFWDLSCGRRAEWDVVSVVRGVDEHERVPYVDDAGPGRPWGLAERFRHAALPSLGFALRKFSASGDLRKIASM